MDYEVSFNYLDKIIALCYHFALDLFFWIKFVCIEYLRFHAKYFSEFVNFIVRTLRKT